MAISSDYLTNDLVVEIDDNITRNEYIIQNENDFDDSHCKKHFPEKVEQLFACGEVVLPNPQQIEHVNLLIGINKEEEFQHINLADKSFTHGVFCREIPLPKTNKTGIYHLDVYLKRNIIASTDFTIQ